MPVILKSLFYLLVPTALPLKKPFTLDQASVFPLADRCESTHRNPSDLIKDLLTVANGSLCVRVLGGGPQCGAGVGSVFRRRDLLLGGHGEVGDPLESLLHQGHLIGRKRCE